MFFVFVIYIHFYNVKISSPFFHITVERVIIHFLDHDCNYCRVGMYGWVGGSGTSSSSSIAYCMDGKLSMAYFVDRGELLFRSEDFHSSKCHTYSG